MPRATLEDLLRTPGKAELIGGVIVPLGAAGHRPSRVAASTFRALFDHAERAEEGWVFTASMRFAVPELASGRESFSPDVSYYLGPIPEDEMDFVPGPPALAVEVRGKGDYGPAAEAEMAAKRADYFEAGTLVVWDVDPRAGAIHVYRADAPDRPSTFLAGQEADAEPAVPGWRMAVDRIFA